MLYITQISQTLQIDQTVLLNQYKSQIKGQTLKTLPTYSTTLIPYNPDILMASLVMDDMLHHITNHPPIHQIYDLIKQGLQLINDNRLTDLVDQQKIELLTAQMRRDKQLADYDQSKKDHHINQFLITYMQHIIKQINKTNLEAQVKHHFNLQFQQILKRK